MSGKKVAAEDSASPLTEWEVRRCAKALIMADAIEHIPSPPIGPHNVEVADIIRFLVSKIQDLTGESHD